MSRFHLKRVLDKVKLIVMLGGFDFHFIGVAGDGSLDGLFIGWSYYATVQDRLPNVKTNVTKTTEMNSRTTVHVSRHAALCFICLMCHLQNYITIIFDG